MRVPFLAPSALEQALIRQGPGARMGLRSTRRLVGRSILAAPFVLSLLLTLALGPGQSGAASRTASDDGHGESERKDAAAD